MVSIYCWFKTKTHEWGGRDTESGVFWFGQKSLGIYFFFTWKAKNQWILSINTVTPEIAKRRILAALWRSPVLSILQTENLKRKKPVGLTGVFFIIFAHPYSRLVLRSLGKGGRELLHGRRKPTSSQATARSDFTSKAKRRLKWRCEEKAAPFEWSCASHSEEKTYVFVRHFFGKKNGGERGIRTLGQLPVAGLANLCFRPLSHLSA